MDGMAPEGVPEPIQEQLDAMKDQAEKLSDLLDDHGYDVSQAPIDIALDEVGAEIEAADARGRRADEAGQPRHTVATGEAAVTSTAERRLKEQLLRIEMVEAKTLQKILVETGRPATGEPIYRALREIRAELAASGYPNA